MTPDKWLQRFLETRELKAPDARSLYKYKMSEDEYNDLKSSLKFISTLNSNVTSLSLIRRWNMIFVIYGAEWWRREYEGGSWRWETLFKSFGAESSKLQVQQRSEIIISGLRYWGLKVRLINDKFRYLGTISIEGGLPLNQLNNNSGWLGRVFGSVIPKFKRLQHTGIKAETLIRECDYIPKTYQNDQIYIILGDIVKTTVNLKQAYQLDKKQNPLEYLDTILTNWRADFPLPIEDAVGKRLLGELFKPIYEETINLPFRGFRSLDDKHSLHLQIEFAGFIALETLDLPETIPSRLTVDLVSNEGSIYTLGTSIKTMYKGKSSLKMPVQNRKLTNDLATQGYSVRFKELTTLIYQAEIIGCEELANDVPWIFVRKSDGWVLEGVASVCTKAREVKILYPESFSSIGTTEIIEISTVNNKKLIQLAGEIKLIDNENTSFLIKTAQAHDTKTYYLTGKTLTFDSKPTKVYLGLPKLVWFCSETNTRAEVNARNLVGRSVNSRDTWQALTIKSQGVYEIRLLDEERNTKFRAKCVLLPEDFLVRFKPSHNSLDGSIVLENIGTAAVSCESTLKHKVLIEDQKVQLALIADSTPPENVQVTLCWPNKTEMLILKLPFPARGGQLIDGAGYRSSTTKGVFADQLYGYRLRLFNEQPNFKRHLQIEISLKDDLLPLESTRDLYFRNSIEVQGSIIELAVIDYQSWIKSLLALSRNLDSYSTLVVYEAGTEILRVNIYRYQFALEPDWTKGSVILSEGAQVDLSYDDLANIKLMAMRLAQPEQEHITLEKQVSEQTTVGSWFFYPEKREAGPWIIYPSVSSSVTLRPILWQVGGAKEVSEIAVDSITTLHTAVTLADKDTRHEVVNSILSKMHEDFSHSGWDYLRQLALKNNHLPLITFDIWSVAVTNTKFLAALVLQMDEPFSQRFGEELPVFWELIPLQEWLEVFSVFREYLRKVIDDEADVSGLLKGRIKKIGYLCDSMEIVTDILKVELFGEVNQELNLMRLAPDFARQITFDAINNSKQELLTRHANSSWSELLKAELVSHATSSGAREQQLLNISDMQDHQRAVLILPILLAFCSSEAEIPRSWVGDAVIIFKLKCLKDFDSEWFNASFKILLAYLSQQLTH
jgi:hypothetical protein